MIAQMETESALKRISVAFIVTVSALIIVVFILYKYIGKNNKIERQLTALEKQVQELYGISSNQTEMIKTMTVSLNNLSNGLDNISEFNRIALEQIKADNDRMSETICSLQTNNRIIIGTLAYVKSLNDKMTEKIKTSSELINSCSAP